MRLGFAVKVLGDGGLPSHDTRRWQSEPSLGVSLDRLEAVLRSCAAPLEEQVRKVGRRVEPKPVLPQLRAHADMIDPIGFEHFVTETAAGLPDFDIMLEAKGKDLAFLALRARLEQRGVSVRRPAARR